MNIYELIYCTQMEKFQLNNSKLKDTKKILCHIYILMNNIQNFIMTSYIGP